MAEPVRPKRADAPPERLETGYEPPSDPRDRGGHDSSEPRERLDAETTYVLGADPPPARPHGGLRGFVDEIFFAGVGAVALTKERMDELVDDLAGRGELTRDEARDVVEGAAARWRGDAARLGERASGSVAGMLREAGLVTRREWEELELRLSQVEHRLRLVEREEGAAPDPPRRPQGGVRRR